MPDEPTAPLIGLPGRRRTGAHITDFPPILDDAAVDVYLADYARSIIGSGGVPVHLSLDVDPLTYLPYLDGIILTGGADVEPRRYQREPDGNGAYEPERDDRELSLLGGALGREVPVLGICRGLQVINVQAGGTLNQHVPTHCRFDLRTDSLIHKVSLEPDSRLSTIYHSAGAAMEVNSLHHQTVDRLGAGLRATAVDPDGTVEGIEHTDHDVIAVQWHPEMLPAPDPIFDWLVERARARRDRRP